MFEGVTIENNFKICLKFNFEIVIEFSMWADGNVRTWPSPLVGGWPWSPPTKCSQCTVHDHHLRTVCICLPSEPPWGSAHSNCEAPIHFRLQFTAWFRVLSTCTCRAQGCCFSRWRGRPFWWASQCSAGCRPSSRALPRACGRHLSVHNQIVACQVPPMSCFARRQSEWSRCWPQSGLLTWHPSASTADSLLIDTTFDPP